MFSSRLTDGLRDLPAGVTERLDLAPGSVQIRPDAVQGLPAGPRDAFLDIFIHGLHGAFLLGAIFAGLAFLLTWALPEIPLRGDSAAEMRASTTATAAPDAEEVAA